MSARISAGDLQLPEGIALLSDPEEMVATVTALRAEEVEEVGAERDIVPGVFVRFVDGAALFRSQAERYDRENRYRENLRAGGTISLRTSVPGANRVCLTN